MRRSNITRNKGKGWVLDMTKEQERVYNFIVEYVKEHLYAPSMDDIRKGCGYSSKSTVSNHLYNLQAKGLIELGEYNSPRCIKLVGYTLKKEDL